MTTRTITVLTHGRPSETAGALRELAELADRHGAVLALDADEPAKHSKTHSSS